MTKYRNRRRKNFINMQQLLKKLSKLTMSSTSKIMTTMIEHSKTKRWRPRCIKMLRSKGRTTRKINYNTNQQLLVDRTRKRKNTSMKNSLKKCNNTTRALQQLNSTNYARIFCTFI